MGGERRGEKMGERLLRGSRDRRETERSKERERERDIGSENINYNTNARTTHTFPACRHMFQKMLETMGVDNVIAIDHIFFIHVN